MNRYYIFFLSLLLFSILVLNSKSVSYAFTWEDFIDFTSSIKNEQINSNFNFQTNLVLRYQNNITNAVPVENFVGFIAKANGTGYGDIYLFNSAVSITNGVNPSRYSARFTINQNNGSVSYTSSGGNFTALAKDSCWGLLELSNSPDLTGYYLQNRFTYFNLLGAENRDIDLLPWYFGDARVGSSYYTNNLVFKLYDQTGINYKYLNAVNQTQVNGGYLYQLEIPNVEGLINGDLYYVQYENLDQPFFHSEDFIISWTGSIYIPPGTITNPSGDVTGNIDLTGITNSIDNVNNSIQEQTQSIISGDNQIIEQLQENNSFIHDVYDSLFNLQSGDTSEILLLVESYFPSGDTPISIYDTIFGSFQNDPDDFVITWENHPLNITWFGGEVLYSGDFIKARVHEF